MNPGDLDGPTRATDAAVQRVRGRLESELSPEDIRRCLMALPGPASGAEVRVRARLNARSTASNTSLRRPWIVGAGVVFGVVLLGTTAMAAVSIALAPPAPVVLDQPLAQQPVTPRGLALSPRGDGDVAGTSEDARIQWRSGTLEVSTKYSVTVETREATIAVVSAAAVVERSALGTDTRGLEGTVHVSCHAGEDRRLAVGESVLCRPVSVDGMLGRVRALSSTGLAANALLDEIATGLARSEGTAVARTELGLLRAFTLASAEQPDLALQAARSWLDEGHTLRREKVHRLAAGLALQLEGCDGARPHLEALSAEDPDALAALEDCTGGSP